MRILRDVGITILIALAIFTLLRVTMQGYTVEYCCMVPNIQDGDWVVVNKASYFFSEPKRGDVIVFHPPEELSSNNPFIKRIIGLPQETVEIKNNKVFINGIPLEEKYVNEPPYYTMPLKQIPEDEYFVLGDNRNHSNDSHTGWTVPWEEIVGKAYLIYWPADRWGIIHGYSYAS